MSRLLVAAMLASSCVSRAFYDTRGMPLDHAEWASHVQEFDGLQLDDNGRDARVEKILADFPGDVRLVIVFNRLIAIPIAVYTDAPGFARRAFDYLTAILFPAAYMRVTPRTQLSGFVQVLVSGESSADDVFARANSALETREIKSLREESTLYALTMPLQFGYLTLPGGSGPERWKVNVQYELLVLRGDEKGHAFWRLRPVVQGERSGQPSRLFKSTQFEDVAKSTFVLRLQIEKALRDRR